ncbi:hypothetical protein CGZ80_05755 [Rhodopirellula sp. MGV]|nr:hypothetical protein CGZ80_05755 [Rhodopirellula sp. MGV]PNY38054.1 hypothetical protein C2E31_04675 [Rhodopirellula baltica]
MEANFVAVDLPNGHGPRVFDRQTLSYFRFYRFYKFSGIGVRRKDDRTIKKFARKTRVKKIVAKICCPKFATPSVVERP